MAALVAVLPSSLYSMHIIFVLAVREYLTTNQNWLQQLPSFFVKLMLNAVRVSNHLAAEQSLHVIRVLACLDLGQNDQNQNLAQFITSTGALWVKESSFQKFLPYPAPDISSSRKQIKHQNSCKVLNNAAANRTKRMSNGLAH